MLKQTTHAPSTDDVQRKEVARPAPGKQTLTDLQLKEGSGGASGVHEAAAAGISGTGGPLPHAATIQSLFGRHDVSGITAHQDSAAADATSAMGARAYATGSHVAFGGNPD